MRSFVTVAWLAVAAGGCGDSDCPATTGPSDFRFSTTRLCALVPARDPAAAAFPPTPPVKVFGTDLGWTYEHHGVTTILFGDSWQRIDICPLQPNDDTLATLGVPDDDWPGFSASTSIPDSQCPELTYPVDAAGTAFAPLDLQRWDGVPVPLGPLNTPVTGFSDGEREWGIFIVGGGQPCASSEGAAGAPCSTALSPQAADLVCGQIGQRSSCVDPTGTRTGAGAEAYYLHIAERVGTTSYVSRAMFLTNKYLNLTARAVRAFDPSERGGRDYGPGTGALLVWGRPGFDDQQRLGEMPPYFLYHPLPFDIRDERIVFTPRYFTGVADGAPTFGDSQRAATPLYTGEFAPVNHAAVSYIEALRQWLMIYGGSSTDFIDRDGTGGDTQPVRGALFARTAPDPWGPWTDPELVLTNEQVAQDFVCGRQSPAGCLPPPDPPIRPGCLEVVDPLGGGNLYGANIIDVMTRATRAERGRGPAVDVFWNVSTWHPYSVVLLRTRVEALP